MRRRRTRALAAGVVALAAVATGCMRVHPAPPSRVSLTATATPPAHSSPARTPKAHRPPLAGLVVVVDPGHNGGNASHLDRTGRLVNAGGFRKRCNTTGTETNAGYPEHAFTWNVARRLARLLRSAGARVILTRHSDHGVGPCVDRRGLVAAHAHADLLLSVHGDGGPPDGHGFAVLRPGRVPGYTARMYGQSHRLATAVADALVGHEFARSTYLGSHGIEVRRDLGTLNRAGVPAVMVETGNMRNAHDAALMSRAQGRQRVAAALAAGVAAYAARR